MQVDTPAARNTDPVTSHEAAQHITESGARHTQRQRVAEALRSNPGTTTAELAALTGIGRYEVGRRMSECETAGDASRGSKKRCSITGRSALMWWPVPKQGRLV